MAMSIGPTAGYFGTSTTAPTATSTASTTTTSAPAAPGGDTLSLSSGNQVTGTVKAAMTGQSVSGAPSFETKAVGAIRAAQNVVASWAAKFWPQQKPGTLGVQSTQTFLDKAKAVGKAALFFAIPVGGAAAVACGLGWAIGPLVPFVGGHVFGAVAGALAVGETAGFLLHGVMRLNLITDPAQREINSAGATVGSAVLGAGFAGAIAMAAGAPITLPIIGLGALLGAGPRMIEWALAKL
jgi:hypothetical protein